MGYGWPTMLEVVLGGFWRGWLTRGAIGRCNAICQEQPGLLLFRLDLDGKGRYDAGDAGTRYEVRD